MIFLHIVDDYYLQSNLLSLLKQKKYWEENAPDTKYKYDYIWALIMHAFSWAFMIMLPIGFLKGFYVDVTFVIIFISNVLIHAVVDHIKANKLKINLWTDQLIHMIQIIITAIILL
jgi:hypothetical protein